MAALDHPARVRPAHSSRGNWEPAWTNGSAVLAERVSPSAVDGREAPGQGHLSVQARGGRAAGAVRPGMPQAEVAPWDRAPARKGLPAVSAGRSAAGVRVVDRMIVVAGSRLQVEVGHPVAAFDLYTGGRVTALRQRLGGVPAYRRRVRPLSSVHALVHADQNLALCLQPLTVQRAYQLREPIAADVQREWALDGVPSELLVVASPWWMVAFSGVLTVRDRPRVLWFTESDDDWTGAWAVLDRWAWP